MVVSFGLECLAFGRLYTRLVCLSLANWLARGQFERYRSCVLLQVVRGEELDDGWRTKGKSDEWIDIRALNNIGKEYKIAVAL